MHRHSVISLWALSLEPFELGINERKRNEVFKNGANRDTANEAIRTKCGMSEGVAIATSDSAARWT